MRASIYSGLGLSVAIFVGCQQTVTPLPFRALTGSERVSLLCREMTTGTGRDIHACPDSDRVVADGEDRRTFALVTQTVRGEVAAIDLHASAVIDEDPSLPGNEFLPVGSMPTSIVSTPGGVASFVGVGEPGREAIFALPTSCITAPNQGDPAREITLWSACRLPSRPGEMAIVADAAADASTCGEPTSIYQRWNPENANALEFREDCPANLQDEERVVPAGRRKLVVTLPDEGKIAIFDAQAILNLQKGTFATCVPDRVIALSNTLPPPPIDQKLPDDLRVPVAPTAEFVPDDLVGVIPPTYANPKRPFEAIPAGIAVADKKVYVADIGTPLIHVIDVSDPCAAFEDLPLRPLDFDVPNRPVYTSSLSVSSPTLAGRDKHQRFLYAVDVEAGGSAMMFDLSDGASKAPIVRPHVPELPFEAPDRIRFESPIERLQLITHDAPAIDPTTKLGELGVACNPYPGAEPPGSLYRTSEDYSKGAAPRKLRGIFGIVALGTGQMAAVDIEDWDAPCRRPKSNNPSPVGKDWLGCAQDPALGRDWFAEGSVATVSDESSCNVIEPHRMRSGHYFRTDSTRGAAAPSVVNFPRLSLPEVGDLATGKADQLRKHPQMLAVPYVDNAALLASGVNAAYLNVGTTRYTQASGERYSLDTDPAKAAYNSLILPMSEPRVYPARENFTATFEGPVIAERTSGQLPVYTAAEATKHLGRELLEDEILLRDPDAWFCDQGVEAYNLAYHTGKELLAAKNPDGDGLGQFATKHADFVVLTGDFTETDPYFKDEHPIAQCGQRTGKEALKQCQSWFGTKDDKKPTRDFMIRDAQSDDLVLVPRVDNPAVWVEHVQCCFPSVHSYEVRAGQQWVVRGGALLHSVRGNGPNASCSKDEKSVRRFKLRSRAFEISSAQPCPEADNSNTTVGCGVGAADSTAVEACVLPEQPVEGVSPNIVGPGKTLHHKCIFEALKGRFAIYRGNEPSKRDMVFRWSVTGGFSPMASTIATGSVGLNVIPVDLVYSDSLDALVVVDGASGGVNLINLTNFAPMGTPFL